MTALARIITFRDEHGLVVEPDDLNDIERLQRQLAEERRRGEELRQAINAMLSELHSRWWLGTSSSNHLDRDAYEEEVLAALDAVQALGSQALVADAQHLLPGLRYELVRRNWR